MKKRAMKKWIPEGEYCYKYGGSKGSTACKWLKYCGTIKRNRDNCELSSTCKKNCSNSSCINKVYRCEYIRYTDFTEESLLWDFCKECGEKLTKFNQL